MFSNYRTLFEIRINDNTQVGPALLGDIEGRLRAWVHRAGFPEVPEILDEPERDESGRRWEHNGDLLRLSGGSEGEQGYFWMRWYVDHYLADGLNRSQRYLGFRLATEGGPVQADVEVKVGDREQGHFDDALRELMETLLSCYRCAALGTDLALSPKRVPANLVTAFWNHLVSLDRRLPVVVVSERRPDGTHEWGDELPELAASEQRIGDLPVAVDALQRDLIGLAEVACCADQAAWILGWHSRNLLCHDGQVRIYAPGLRAGDDETRHLVWDAEEISNLGYDRFVQLLRDECARRVHYPEGRDALRVFSRVRGQLRQQLRARLSDETQDWVTEVQEKENEIEGLETENEQLKIQVARLEQDKRTLQHHLRAAQSGSREIADASVVDKNEIHSDSIKTIADAVQLAENFRYVRVFKEAVKGWAGPATDARRFFSVLERLENCGPSRAAGNLMGQESDWMRNKGFNFAAGEGESTMKQHGDTRRFRDDDGNIWEMQSHIRVGPSLRIHLCWDDEGKRCLVGYFGQHLPIASK